MSSKKNKLTADQRLAQESARLFGKHVSREKGRLLLVLSLLACAAPMVLGLRLWQAIPDTVPTGLTLSTGQDDSMPRAVAVFGLPGLMCVLDGICHVQLRVNQDRMTLPKAPVRLLGRWGFPILSVIFCSGFLLGAAGQSLSLPFLTPCALGLAAMILGAHMYDCPKSATLALRFSFTQRGDSWQAVHRFAGWVWLLGGLAIIAAAMAGLGPLADAVLILLVAAAPFVYGVLRPTKLAGR